MIRAAKLSFADVDADVLTNCLDRSLLGSFDFLNLWVCQGGEPVLWAAEENDNILALLPGVEFGAIGLKRFQSIPDGLYTRVFLASTSDRMIEEYAGPILDGIAGNGYAKVYLYDYYDTLATGREYDALEHETTIVDISSPDWQPPDKKIQSEIRKAEREGIVVSAFDAERHFDKFMILMNETESRHDRDPKYSAEFYRSLAELSTRDDRVVWLWCEQGGEGAASHIFLIEDDMALNWQVYFDKRFSFLKPNQYILYSQAESLRARGVTRLNLGASLPEAEGLKTYKNKWGGETVLYRSLIRKAGLGRLF